jgi:hypothetical protein
MCAVQSTLRDQQQEHTINETTHQRSKSETAAALTAKEEAERATVEAKLELAREQGGMHPLLSL